MNYYYNIFSNVLSDWLFSDYNNLEKRHSDLSTCLASLHQSIIILEKALAQIPTDTSCNNPDMSNAFCNMTTNEIQLKLTETLMLIDGINKELYRIKPMLNNEEASPFLSEICC